MAPATARCQNAGVLSADEGTLWATAARAHTSPHIGALLVDGLAHTIAELAHCIDGAGSAGGEAIAEAGRREGRQPNSIRRGTQVGTLEQYLVTAGVVGADLNGVCRGDAISGDRHRERER